MMSPATEKAAQLRGPKGIYEIAPPRDQVVPILEVLVNSSL